MLAKTLLTLFAAVAAIAAPTDLDDRALEERDLESRALCSGTLIDGPRKILNMGTLYTYYSSANGGTNCAYVTNDTGKKLDMYISMIDTSAAPGDKVDPDSGKFSEYAGPVKLTNMAKHCMKVSVGIAGKSWASRRDWHCGGGKLYKPPANGAH